MLTTIVVLSDTHNQLHNIAVPDGDIVIHCGDFCIAGTSEEVAQFNDAFVRLPHQYKIVVAGNHDVPFLGTEKALARKLLDRTITYLEDESIDIHGLRFFGSPYRSRMMVAERPKAFRLGLMCLELIKSISSQQDAVWDKIPQDVDVLITHGPPHGILDIDQLERHIGCEQMRKRVDTVRPRVHCFGHVHPSYGYLRTDSTLFVNGASVDDDYQPKNPPFVLTITDSVVEIEPVHP